MDAYDSWKSTRYEDSFDYDDRPTWKDLEERDKKLEIIEDFFQGVIDELYGNIPVDNDRLEWYLAEIASAVDLKIPKGGLRLSKEELAHAGAN